MYAVSATRYPSPVHRRVNLSYRKEEKIEISNRAARTLQFCPFLVDGGDGRSINALREKSGINSGAASPRIS